MKEIFDKLKQKYSGAKIEILLMILFVCLFLVLNGPEIARETIATYAPEENGMGTAVEVEDTDETEFMSEMQDETEALSETEALTETKTEHETDESPLSSEEESQERLPVLGLADTKVLHGYQPLLPYEQPKEGNRPFFLLRTMIENRISDYDGTWSVYVKDLTADKSFVINDQPMKSASVMKLFIMGAVYKSFETGHLERTEEIMSLMNDMITVSDNEASNQLLYLLGESSYERGIEMVDEFIREYGFSDMTVEYNGFNNSATNTGNGNYNQVAAKDCGKLLEDIYRRTWVNRSVSNEMEDMLLNQHTRYKIPAGLPEGVLCGNKTGEMDATENDAAIIFAGDCDYILVVLSSDWNSKDEAISRIKSISSMVYEFLN